MTLQWSVHGVLNHQQIDSFFTSLFRLTAKKFDDRAFLSGIYKRPVMQKCTMSCRDVIMKLCDQFYLQFWTRHHWQFSSDGRPPSWQVSIYYRRPILLRESIDILVKIESHWWFSKTWVNFLGKIGLRSIKVVVIITRNASVVPCKKSENNFAIFRLKVIRGT